MIHALISSRRRAHIHQDRMRARYEDGVAQVDQTDAAYRDRHLITSRSAKACLAFAVVAMVLLALSAA
ncbi:hypothetical protein [Streptomyces sp. NPDC048650]|uniref:hypothetical protein n=1 Tax=Streptomyces sp. NPDC048650 TaxID=3365583 RepID=UPI00371F6599